MKGLRYSKYHGLRRIGTIILVTADVDLGFLQHQRALHLRLLLGPYTQVSLCAMFHQGLKLSLFLWTMFETT